MRILSPWFPAALAGPDHQHPSLAAAGLQGPARPAAGARCRRAGERLHGAFRDPRARCRPDHRPGGGAGAGRRHGRHAGRTASCARSTGSIRWSCAGSPRAASRQTDGKVEVTGVPPGATLLFSDRTLVRYRNRTDFNGETNGRSEQRRVPRPSRHLHELQQARAVHDPVDRAAARRRWRSAWSAASHFLSLLLGVGGTIALLVAFAILG